MKGSEQLDLGIPVADQAQGAKVHHEREGTPARFSSNGPPATARESPADPYRQATPPRVALHVPRVLLTICEAAQAVGVSTDTFRRFILPELRVVRASPRLTLVRIAELERWAARREALAESD